MARQLGHKLWHKWWQHMGCIIFVNSWCNYHCSLLTIATLLLRVGCKGCCPLMAIFQQSPPLTFIWAIVLLLFQHKLVSTLRNIIWWNQNKNGDHCIVRRNIEFTQKWHRPIATLKNNLLMTSCKLGTLLFGLFLFFDYVTSRHRSNWLKIKILIGKRTNIWHPFIGGKGFVQGVTT